MTNTPYDISHLINLITFVSFKLRRHRKLSILSKPTVVFEISFDPYEKFFNAYIIRGGISHVIV